MKGRVETCLVIVFFTSWLEIKKAVLIFLCSRMILQII